MNRHRANRVINSGVFQQVSRPNENQSTARADEESTEGVNPIAWSSDRDKPSQKSVDGDTHIPFFTANISVNHCGQAGGTSCQCGVERNSPDALHVQCRQRAARIETVPTEPQNQATARANDYIMCGHGSAAITFENTTQARTKNDGASQGDRTTDRVHNCRAGEVTESQWLHNSQPTIWTPSPVTNDGINETSDNDAVEQVADKARATDHCARCDRGACISKRKLEDPEG